MITVKANKEKKITVSFVFWTLLKIVCQSLVISQLFWHPHEYVQNVFFFYQISLWFDFVLLFVALVALILVESKMNGEWKFDEISKFFIQQKKKKSVMKQVWSIVSGVFFFAAFATTIMIKDVSMAIVFGLIFCVGRGMSYYGKSLYNKYRERIEKLYPELTVEIPKKKI